METKKGKLFLFVLGRQSNKGLNQYHPRGVHPKFYACVIALMFALEMSFAEIIIEGPPFHPVDTLKIRPSGPIIGDS
jgi:hypothetical protein